MGNKWIEASGVCKENEMITLLQQNMPDGIFLMGCTDCYETGLWNDKIEMDVSTTLELRVFNRKKEILFTRSMLSSDFQWRVATEDGLSSEVDYFDSLQYIDINENKSVYDENTGMVTLFTTVGGKYKLPIKDGENVTRVRKYLSYDENGMAHIVDQRVVAFEKKMEV